MCVVFSKKLIFFGKGKAEKMGKMEENSIEDQGPKVGGGQDQATPGWKRLVLRAPRTNRDAVYEGGRPLRHRRPVNHEEELLHLRVARDVLDLVELVCVLAAGDRVEGNRRNALRDCKDNVVNPGFTCSYQSTQYAFR